MTGALEHTVRAPRLFHGNGNGKKIRRRSNSIEPGWGLL